MLTFTIWAHTAGGRGRVHTRKHPYTATLCSWARNLGALFDPLLALRHQKSWLAASTFLGSIWLLSTLSGPHPVILPSWPPSLCTALPVPSQPLTEGGRQLYLAPRCLPPGPTSSHQAPHSALGAEPQCGEQLRGSPWAGSRCCEAVRTPRSPGGREAARAFHLDGLSRWPLCSCFLCPHRTDTTPAAQN